MTTLLAGLVFGLVGSGHCAAMCGPLVLLANPNAAARAVGTAPLAMHTALYHGGRTLTYLALGGLAGLAGSAVARLGLGRALAIVAGVALLVQALAATRLVTPRLGSFRIGSIVTRALGRAGVWMRTHRVQGPLAFGVLNGLLPCGLLYAALTAAAGVGDLGQALAFMGAFAIGTTPVLALIALAGSAATARVPMTIRRAAPVALAIVGVLLIARGIREPHAAHDPTASPNTSAPAHTSHR